MLVDLKDLMSGPLHCCGCGCYVRVDHVLAIVVNAVIVVVVVVVVVVVGLDRSNAPRCVEVRGGGGRVFVRNELLELLE